LVEDLKGKLGKLGTLKTRGRSIMLAFPDSGGKGERQEKRVSPEEKDRSTDATVTVRINYLLGKADLMYNDLAC